MLILQPWQEGPRVSLEAYLRELHESDAAERKAEIEKRKAEGIPLSDDTDWKAVAADGETLAKAIARNDAVAARVACKSIEARTADTLTEPGPFEPVEGWEGLHVVFRTIPEARRAALVATVSGAFSAYAATLEPFDAVKNAAATSALAGAWGGYIAAGVARVEGLTQLVDGEEQPLPIEFVQDSYAEDDQIDVLARAGLLQTLYAAASRFQRMPAKKAVRCGLSPLLTSASLIAGNVHSTDGRGLAVLVAPHNGQPVNLPISPGPNTQTTVAHVGT